MTPHIAGDAAKHALREWVTLLHSQAERAASGWQVLSVLSPAAGTDATRVEPTAYRDEDEDIPEDLPDDLPDARAINGQKADMRDGEDDSNDSTLDTRLEARLGGNASPRVDMSAFVVSFSPRGTIAHDMSPGLAPLPYEGHPTKTATSAPHSA